jgi:hypothetical protein
VVTGGSDRLALAWRGAVASLMRGMLRETAPELARDRAANPAASASCELHPKAIGLQQGEQPFSMIALDHQDPALTCPSGAEVLFAALQQCVEV